MAVQLVLGSSGAGKSHYIFEHITKEAQENLDQQYLVIVPEQFTMQTQKELVQMNPGGGILNIDVLSFQRLAYRVFEEVGGDNRRLLEETGKTLVLEKIVQNNKKDLKYLGSQITKPGYIQEMKSLISELMQYDIGQEEMAQMVARAEDKTLLFEKMKDVQLLYREFRKYLQEEFLTGEEVLDVLCQKLNLSEKIKQSTIVLDGFTGFTPIQYKVLEQFMLLCPKVYITVTIDAKEKLMGKWKPYELFAMSKEMIHQVEQLALKTKTTQEEPKIVEAREQSRFAQSPSLEHLERWLFRYGQHPYEEKPEELNITTAANPLAEMTEVARQISRFIRTKGMRYGEMAVITGDLDTYGNYAKQVFEQTGIPYFIDRKHSVLMNPFVEYVRSALDVMADNFSYSSVFRHLRCGMSEVTSEEIDQLENYVIALGIRSRKQWENTWVRVYPQMSAGDILKLNEIKKRAMDNLFCFADAFKQRGNTVAQDARALYDYIVSGNIQKKLEVSRLKFAGEGDGAMEKEYAQIYGIVMNLLDKLVEILGQEKITQKEFVQLVEAGLAEATVGIIPPSTDQILVGDMERTRLKDIKVLFFVGMNEGIIPKTVGSGGLLAESDREFFKEEGVTLAPTPRESMYMQRFYLYLNLTKPSRYLQLSYSASNAKGENVGPAYLVGTIQQMFPALQIQDKTLDFYEMNNYEHPIDGINGLIEGMRQLQLREPNKQWKELYSWFFAAEEYKELREKLLEAAFYRNPEDEVAQSVAKLLYGEVSVHSATRLEKFSACAFAHFLQYGLALKERAQYEFTPMDMGNVMHNALEHFAQKIKENKLDWKNLTSKQRQIYLEESLHAVVDDYGNTILHSSARNEYMIGRVERLLNRTLWALQEQLKNGEFYPEGFEVSIGGGRIDRLDICETEDKVYVKVMDYKTGNTSFDLLAVYHGLQLQLMVYLDGALQIEQKNHPEKEVEPAGVFYYNIKDPMLREKAEYDLDGLDQKLLKELKMNGLVSADMNVLRKMDETLNSLPVSLNKNGSFSKYSTVANREQFKGVLNYARGKMYDIKENIEQGQAQIAPYELGKKNGCTYCPYGSVCGFDQKIPGFSYRRLKQFSDEELWAQMEGEA